MSKLCQELLYSKATFYQEHQILPSIKPDNPHKGVPSDHSGVIALPNRSIGKPPIRSKEIRHVRPMSESGLKKFGNHFVQQDWNFWTSVQTQQL